MQVRCSAVWQCSGMQLRQCVVPDSSFHADVTLSLRRVRA
eukprot:COSAG03_NODE_18463_length_354_cov_1.023529_1_plen_39_part_01